MKLRAANVNVRVQQQQAMSEGFRVDAEGWRD
jgi:hypothetical protein